MKAKRSSRPRTDTGARACGRRRAQPSGQRDRSPHGRLCSDAFRPGVPAARRARGSEGRNPRPEPTGPAWRPTPRAHARRPRALCPRARGGYLGAGQRAVHDGVAAVEREGVLQLGQALLREVVSGVDHPAIGLGERALVSRAALTGRSSPLTDRKAPGVQSAAPTQQVRLHTLCSCPLSEKGFPPFHNIFRSPRPMVPTNL